jgi:hypothetical protein
VLGRRAHVDEVRVGVDHEADRQVRAVDVTIGTVCVIRVTMATEKLKLKKRKKKQRLLLLPRRHLLNRGVVRRRRVRLLDVIQRRASVCMLLQVSLKMVTKSVLQYCGFFFFDFFFFFFFFFFQRGGDFLKSIVYGSMDGLITTFAVVTAVVGGDLKVGTVLIL